MPECTAKLVRLPSSTLTVFELTTTMPAALAVSVAATVCVVTSCGNIKRRGVIECVIVCAAVMVTVCGVFQSAGVKTSVLTDALRSAYRQHWLR